MKTIIVGGTNSKELAKKTARKIRAQYSELQKSRFPDGEMRLRYADDITGKHVVIINSLSPNPDEMLLESAFAIHAARQLGAARTTFVAPYLAYMRQDKQFHPGECISARAMAKILDHADQIIAIDPHLHRIRRLQDIFRAKAKSISTDPVLAEYISKNHPKAIIIGPDIESSQWAKTIADSIGQESMILLKKRYSSTKVRIIVHGDPSKFKGRDVVIVDDIISTGHTMIEPIRQLKKFGAKKITCICVHGVLVGNALQKLQKLGAQVITTNTIPNPAAKIDVSGIIAGAL
ncbi:MAG: ribose-phosphate diphosphokinase [Candidatus Woesearchaeota archaeon]